MINLKVLESITDDQLNNFESYAEEHQVYDLFQDIVRQLAIHQPKEPILWIANHLEKKPVPSVIVLAPPTANESKLCEALAKAMKAEHISTRQLLQTAIEKKNHLGQQALPFFVKGQLVPDRVVFDLLALRIGQMDVQRSGYVLEGFPKTRAQMQMMQKRGFLPTHWLHFDYPIPELLERIQREYIDPVTNRQYDTREDIDPEIRARLTQRVGYTLEAVQDRVQTFLVHHKQIEATCPNLISVPMHLAHPFAHQLRVAAQALHVRPAYRGPVIHRLYLCGGTKKQRHAICTMLESHYKLLYITRQRLYLDTPGVDPDTQPIESVISKLKLALTQPSRFGYVIDLDWTVELFKAGAEILPKPNRVLYLRDDNSLFYQFLVLQFERMEHPFFHALPVRGKLQVVEAEPGRNLTEHIRQLLLRPIPYWSILCDEQ